ncbi:AbfB domain-containing protein [Arthrobacter sp. FW305-BF8]|uniref:AbfB domain-containing protein n=1 Tax=Arthrobacter sp. FW305-BF8 TaxID=2879617 RepID=UPI001F01DF69|nr:AbfB domain-containing protein [Arthrobacter sp. FW305-BF8]UKA56379.1 AbfB domain-containing protein [Arthrobacter sp. FW305-BF8]
MAHEGVTVTAASSREGSSSAFLQRGGLSDAAGASFESVDVPGSYLALRNGGLVLAKVGKDERTAATFFLRS